MLHIRSNVRVALVVVPVLALGACAGLPNSFDRKGERVQLNLLTYGQLAAYPQRANWGEENPRKTEFEATLASILPEERLNSAEAYSPIEEGARTESVAIAAAAIPLVAGFVIDTVQSELSKDAKRYEAQFGSVTYHDSFWTIDALGEQPIESEAERRLYEFMAGEIDQAVGDRLAAIPKSLIAGESADPVPVDELVETVQNDPGSDWGTTSEMIRRSGELQETLLAGRSTLRPTFAGFEVIRRTSKSDPAFRFVGAFVPSRADPRLFLIRPLFLEVDSSKAKVAKTDGASLTIELDMELVGSWLAEKDAFQTATLATAKWAWSGFDMTSEDHFICADFADPDGGQIDGPHIAGWFPGVPRSKDIPGRDPGAPHGGAFRLAINVTERDESKAPQYLERAAKLLGDNKEQIIKQLQSAAQ